MTLTRAPLTDLQFSAIYYSNGGHRIVFPNNPQDRGLVSHHLETFLNSPQLQYVEDLHIVMKLFRVPQDLQGAPRDHAHLYILQRVLNKLSEAKVGRNGPVLRTLALEDPSNWMLTDETRIQGCVSQYVKMALDADVETLQWTSLSCPGYAEFTVVEDCGVGNVEVVEVETICVGDDGTPRLTRETWYRHT
ncbi:hypothetical protein JMJ35_008569 [Cladonia borealis]|uniref:Uncharacterized protein n=1 Tax=Cladonia borealis TaxID=184061 RepID=A0AA39QWV3_9LECA|nr:hypothetical protein JMJ35_008569 [Cladonia borealis]